VGNCSFARHFRLHTPFDWKSGRRSWIRFRLFCHRLRFEHQLLSLPLEFSSRFIHFTLSSSFDGRILCHSHRKMRRCLSNFPTLKST
jgi:hypothetical protein